MGGSHLSADLLSHALPSLDIHVHADYGLPAWESKKLTDSLLIASSYSGNTEETLDFTESALSRGLRPAILASGGKLLQLAIDKKLPYVQIPNTIIQPRVAVGVSLKALAALVGRDDITAELSRLAGVIHPAEHEAEGKRIATEVNGAVVLVYASRKNETIAYNWKIKINETAKVPVFANVFPELNHNELAGFSSLGGKASKLGFKAILIRDNNDHPRVAKRMDITKELLQARGVEIIETELVGESVLLRAFKSLITADWTAYHLALMYKANPDTNKLIEEFKQKIV